MDPVGLHPPLSELKKLTTHRENFILSLFNSKGILFAFEIFM
jgi:hypothetical protein